MAITVEATAEVALKPEQQQALVQAENELLRALDEYEIKIQSLAIAKIQLGRALLNMRQIAQGLGVWEQWQGGDAAKSLMRRLGLGESPSSIQRIMRQAEILGELHYLPAGERPPTADEQHTVELVSQNMSAQVWDIVSASPRSAQKEMLERAVEGKLAKSDAESIREKHTPQQQALDTKPRNQHLPDEGTRVVVKSGVFEGVEGIVVRHENTDLVWVREDGTGKERPVMVGNLKEPPPQSELQAKPSTLKYAHNALAEQAEAAKLTEQRMIKYWGMLLKVHRLISEALADDAIADGYRGRFEAMFTEIEGG